MSKLHHISGDYFHMDDNGELTCRFGMSIICKVETGWGQEGDLVSFCCKGQKLSGPETHVGDIIFMDHRGPETSWLIAKKPRDPRLKLLWEFGYRSNTRVKVEEPSVNSVVHELRVHAGFEYPNVPDDWSWREPLPCGSRKPTVVKDAGDNVLVALYAGRVVGRDTTYCQWYMNEAATMADIKSALIAHSSVNKRYLLLQ